MKHTYTFLLLGAFAFSGCTPIGMATGAGATFGVAAAQEGGLSRATSDLRIQAEINDLWLRSNFSSFLKLDMTVNNGRVLVTGVVQDPEERVEAIRLAWQPKGVTQVINEIQVAESGGIVGFARDSWISTRLRTSLTLDRDVQSINYTIDTVKGVVYLIGVAQNQAELNRVIEKARTIPDVKRVVSYVKLAGQDDPVSASVDGASSSGADSGYSSSSQGTSSYEPQPLNDGDMGYSSGYDNSYDSGNYGASGSPQSIIESEPLRD